MAALKPLSHSRLADLNTTVPPLKKFTVKVLLQKTGDLLRASETHLRNGDQEAAYEMLYKYMGIVVYLQSTPDCKQDMRYLSNMLGGQARVNGAIEQLEVLKNALQKRYEEKERRALALTSPLSQHHRSEPAAPAQNGSAADATTAAPVAPVDHQNAAIDVHEFLRLLQNPQVGVLVMDCRPEPEFKASQIGVFTCLNVPAESIKPGLSAGKIQCELRPDSKKLWAQRSIKDHVILMDWGSGAEEPADKLAQLKRILLDWDPDCTYRNPLRILTGGYELFMHTYPMHTTNAHYRPPHAATAANNSRTFFAHSQQLEAIEYPDLSDIQMKDTLRPPGRSGGGGVVGQPATASRLQSPASTLGRSGSGAPRIDRASKAAALRTIEKETREAERSRLEALEVARELSAVLELAAAVPEADAQQAKRVQDQSYMLENRLMELDVRGTDLDVSIAENAHVLDVEVVNSGAVAGAEGPPRLDEADEAERRAMQETRQRLMEHRHLQERVAEERRQVQRELMAQQELDSLRRRRKHELEEREMERERRERERLEAAAKAMPVFDRAAKPRGGGGSGGGSAEDEDDEEEDDSERPEVVRNFQPESGSGGHGLTGLKNLGNTCYMNSIMQCLSNTDMLREYFVSDTGYRKQFRRTSKTQRQIADEVSAVMREIWLNKHRHISSNDLRRVVGQCKQIFRGMDQQDSHEFLTILMDWLHLDLQLSADRVQLSNPVRTPAEAAWLEFAKGKESHVMQLFYGQIKSTVKCSECLSESATFEGFSNLSLELPEHSDRCDIGDCLRLYFYGEKITGWNCPRCKQKRTAVKKLDISKLPPILVIHLKRFNVDLHSSAATYRKKQNFVRFPLHNFDMSEYIAPSERQSPRVKNTTFQLYGVSNHYGTMDRGHYTAFCKSSYYGRWFKYDDHIVSPMEESDVSTSAAYILFYATTQPR